MAVYAFDDTLNCILCLHVRLICALNYYLLTYLLSYHACDFFKCNCVSFYYSNMFYRSLSVVQRQKRKHFAAQCF